MGLPTLRKFAVAAVAALTLSLAACQVNWVPAYDETFDQQITTAQKDVDTLLTKIAQDTKQPYASFAADYTTAKADLDAMEVRSEGQPGNSDTTNSAKVILETFGKFQEKHSQSTPDQPLSPAFVQGELVIINHQFAILIRQELIKKTVNAAAQP